MNIKFFNIFSTRKIFPGVVERVTLIEKPNAMEYKVIKGMPMKDHQGRMEFTEVEPGVTEIVWSCQYKPKYLGFVLRRVVNNTFKNGLAAFKKKVEKKKK